MCGIAGLWNVTSGAPAERIDLDRMVRALHHRGPDDHGIHLAGPLGIGHTRLSIVDLSGGHQPMCNEDGSIWVVFNGEIYNHKELRAGLITKGHRFATHSDTEVILHQYEELGERCVESFNGQFAFALWDAERHRLLLARDRLGVRPLYYVWSRDGIRFASEIKALFTDPSVPRALDPIALDQIFTFWFPLAPRTGFVGVSEVPPGHTLTVHHGGSTLQRYWAMEFPAEASGRQPRHPERWYRDRLAELLDDAVALRLRADVPVGAYVSGGLDSSVVAAMARRKVNDRLLTFSIGFEAAEFDERSFQSAVVDHLGTQHTACVYRTLDIGREFPAAMWHMERPVLRTAPVPMMRLAQGVRAAGIKVVLTGEGADEVLAGYDIFKEAKVRRFWAQSPDSRFRPLLLRRLYPYLSGVQGQASAYLKGFFGQGLEDTSDPFYSHRPRWQVAGQIKSLLAGHVREGLAEYDAV
ncbi:MAG TPA: asparagine synthase (glutamine-hydrolyzing), partial [Nitrospiria bacterium]|nr:asparagine synthase (glutamine-hydrolyzing) [Nitrospiria bacterium]